MFWDIWANRGCLQRLLITCSGKYLFLLPLTLTSQAGRAAGHIYKYSCIYIYKYICTYKLQIWFFTYGSTILGQNKYNVYRAKLLVKTIIVFKVKGITTNCHTLLTIFSQFGIDDIYSDSVDCCFRNPKLTIL